MPASSRNETTGGERSRLAQFDIENPRVSGRFRINHKKLKRIGVWSAIVLLCLIVAIGLTTIVWFFIEDYVVGSLDKKGVSTRQPITTEPETTGFTSTSPVTTLSSTRKATTTVTRTTSKMETTTFRRQAFTDSSCEPRIVGFYNGFGSHNITESQLRKLTHFVFASIDMNSKGILSFHDFQTKQKFMNALEKSREVNPNLKRMISIGHYAYYSYFAAVAENADKRRNLAKSIISLFQTYQLDGIDIFWKWPYDRKNREPFVLLLREIRQTLDDQYSETPLLLSVVLPSFDWPEYKNTIDLNQILKYVDFVNVFSVRYYGFWDNEWGAYTGPPAPLYSGIGRYEDSNIDWTMNYYVCTTGKPRMLNMGVPFYGAHWKNVEGPIGVKEEMWFSAKPKANGDKLYEGKYLPWREMKNYNWDISSAMWHEETRTPFIWKPKKKEFLGFENERSLTVKMKYAMEKNIGGITIWSVEMDDEEDTLLNSIVQDFTCDTSDGEIKYQCSKLNE